MKYPFHGPKLGLTNVTDSASLLSDMGDSSEWTPSTSRSSSPSFHMDKTISYGGVCCLVKVLQILFLGLLIYGTTAFLQAIFIPNDNISKKTTETFDNMTPHFPKIDRSLLPEPASNVLLDLNDFRILLSPVEGLCNVDRLLFVIIVHSKPDHFRHRKAIRSTWGGINRLEDGKSRPWNIRVVYILGKTPKIHDSNNNNSFNVSELVLKEAERYGDILLGTFPDFYQNLRYKHILGLRWVSTHCSQASFIIKADDDAFIDLPGIKSFLQRILGPLDRPYKDIIAGNVSPDGTKPLRTGKWAVTDVEYPWSQYPPFLGGLAYLMSPDVARDLYRVAHLKDIPTVWVDDVWVTGILRSSLRIHPLYLNARYNYDSNELSSWLRKANHKSPPPCNFAHLDTDRTDWELILKGLWKHVLLSQNIGKDTGNVQFYLSKSDGSLREGIR